MHKLIPKLTFKYSGSKSSLKWISWTKPETNTNRSEAKPILLQIRLEILQGRNWFRNWPDKYSGSKSSFTWIFWISKRNRLCYFCQILLSTDLIFCGKIQNVKLWTDTLIVHFAQSCTLHGNCIRNRTFLVKGLAILYLKIERFFSKFCKLLFLEAKIQASGKNQPWIRPWKTSEIRFLPFPIVAFSRKDSQAFKTN